MKKKLLFVGICLLKAVDGITQNRFPKPDFESGYAYPESHLSLPNEDLLLWIDIALLLLLMSIVAWATVKARTRIPVILVSLISVGYFGFYRSGCVCSIGSVQNVALAWADSSYVLPLSVLLIFILPLLFAFFFGRVFCGGVCPFGALQELVNIRNYRLPKAFATVLGLLPWIYLVFALLYAATRSSFIICRFDPFIGIFRLGGDAGMIITGVLFLVASLFIGRPFCRFVCPYGALLGLVSSVSVWKVRITAQPCISCELCHYACPVDAIRPPYANKAKEERLRGIKRLIGYFVFLPLVVLAGALLLRSISGELSRAHKDVRLYEMVKQHEVRPSDVLSPELEAFYSFGGTLEALTEQTVLIQDEYKKFSTWGGALLGLVIGLTLIGLSVRRTRRQYEIDPAACVACGKCFQYCPLNTMKNRKQDKI